MNEIDRKLSLMDESNIMGGLVDPSDPNHSYRQSMAIRRSGSQGNNNPSLNSMMIGSGPLTGGKNRKYRDKIKELEEKLEL